MLFSGVFTKITTDKTLTQTPNKNQFFVYFTYYLVSFSNITNKKSISLCLF